MDISYTDHTDEFRNIDDNNMNAQEYFKKYAQMNGTVLMNPVQLMQNFAFHYADAVIKKEDKQNENYINRIKAEYFEKGLKASTNNL
jgi:lysyl-tRNA synthetase class I